MSFALYTVDVTTPMSTTEANIADMNDDILVSFGMSDWDNFDVSARYYTGFCDNMFIQATTTAVGTMAEVTADDGTVTMEPDGASEYSIGAAIGWISHWVFGNYSLSQW